MPLLREPEELIKIAKLRQKLLGTDRDDHLRIIDEKEKLIKNLLIKVSLLKHEGIQMLLNEAKQNIREINQELMSAEPKDLSPTGTAAYALSRLRLIDKRDLWKQYMAFFGSAEDDLKTENADLDFQLSDDETRETAGE